MSERLIDTAGTLIASAVAVMLIGVLFYLAECTFIWLCRKWRGKGIDVWKRDDDDKPRMA